MTPSNRQQSPDRPNPKDTYIDGADGWRYIIVRHRLDVLGDVEIEVDATGTSVSKTHTVLAAALQSVWELVPNATVTRIANND